MGQKMLDFQFAETVVYGRPGTSIYWLNESLPDSLIPEEFLRTYSVTTAMPKDSEASISARQGMAECYGGVGVGLNGGSARSVLINGNIVKGCGLTPLAGKGVPFLHATGSLSLKEALYEVCASTISSHILPHSSVNILSIIDCNSNDAFKASPDGSVARVPSALLIREYASRPANMLRSGFILEREIDFPHFDIARSAKSCASFINSFPTTQRCLIYISQFLAACAAQFFWATSLGFVHGSFSASNVCLDGRWLDLATFSYASHKEEENVIGTKRRILEEINQPISIVHEILHNISKQMCRSLSLDPFVSYYNNSLVEARKAFICWLFNGLYSNNDQFESLGRLADKIRLTYIQSAGDRDSSSLDPEKLIYAICHDLWRSDENNCISAIDLTSIFKDLRENFPVSVLRRISCRIYRIFFGSSNYTRYNIEKFCYDVCDSVFSEKLSNLKTNLKYQYDTSTSPELDSREILIHTNNFITFYDVKKDKIFLEMESRTSDIQPLDASTVEEMTIISIEDCFSSRYLSNIHAFLD